MRSAHSQRLERFLGAERIEWLSQSMCGWYGPPIQVIDVPGNVLVHGDGDFTGPFEHGYCASAYDVMVDGLKKLKRGRVSHGMLNAGFASVADYLARVAGGHSQKVFFTKATPSGIITNVWSLWLSAGAPTAGVVSIAAPGGRACDSTTVGAMLIVDCPGDTMHLTGADICFSGTFISCLLYDRIFDVARNMLIATSETVTGVPTRYQSTNPLDPDSASGNFLFPETAVALSASPSFNWDTITYLDQGGAAGTLPAVIGGLSSGIGRLANNSTVQWFMPLASEDTGIASLTAIQTSAALAAGAVSMVIGHPLAWFAFPIATFPNIQYEFITSRRQGPRIFDSACLNWLTLYNSNTSGPRFEGTLEVTSAAP